MRKKIFLLTSRSTVIVGTIGSSRESVSWISVSDRGLGPGEDEGEKSPFSQSEEDPKSEISFDYIS